MMPATTNLPRGTFPGIRTIRVHTTPNSERTTGTTSIESEAPSTLAATSAVRARIPWKIEQMQMKRCIGGPSTRPRRIAGIESTVPSDLKHPKPGYFRCRASGSNLADSHQEVALVYFIQDGCQPVAGG